MEFVQMDLNEVKASEKIKEIYVHEIRFKARNEYGLNLQRHLTDFNRKHETTKFILKPSDAEGEKLGSQQKQVNFRVIQLGDEKPVLTEILTFLESLGLKILSHSTRSYLAKDIPETIQEGEDGLSLFLNQVFCSDLTISKSLASTKEREILHRYQSLLKKIGMRLDLFTAFEMGDFANYVYFQLKEENPKRSHQFKVSVWEDKNIYYRQCTRIGLDEFEEDREIYRDIVMNLSKMLDGVQSFEEINPF